MKIDFSNLKLKVSINAFVGIKKEESEYIFYLPKGYPEKLEPKEAKLLFFQLYGVMKKYKQKEKKRFDGVQQKKSGTGRKEENNKPVFYDNLNIENLISSYEDTKILGFNTKMLTDKAIGYNFDLEDACFTKDNIAVVLETKKENTILSYDIYDIVTMYSFIIYDIYKQMNIELPPIIKQNAMIFLEKYLHPNASFFEGRDITGICKDILHKIDTQSFHSNEYNNFYEQIYKFLYSHPDKDGMIMGIDNFHSIWEELCFHYFFKYHRDNILFADYEKEANCFNRMYCKEVNENNYPFKVTYGDEIRYMYPDLIVKGKEVIYSSPDSSKKIDIYYKYFPNNEEIDEFFQENPESFLLVKDDKWNDYGYRSLFTLYIDKETSVVCKIISLNQEQYDNYDTHGVFKNYENDKIDFSNLKDEILTRFYENGYKTLINRYPDLYISILHMFNDYSYFRITDPNKLNKFRSSDNFKKSFIRDTNEEKILFREFPIINMIIDFKYKTSGDIHRTDVIKQKFYEMAFNEKIKMNKFVLPKYSDDDKLELEPGISTNNTIPIKFWNIKRLLKEYVND